MISYTTVGTNDFSRATQFYDALFAEMGATRLMDLGRFVVYGREMGQPMFGVCTPFDEQPASVGNGVMIALPAVSREEVDRLHAKAMTLGAQNEGEPGERMDNVYVAYFRDPDGNKLNFVHMGEG